MPSIVTAKAGGASASPVPKVRSHAVLVMAAHSAYRTLDLHALKSALCLPVLIDGRHVFENSQAQAAGLIYRGVGTA